MLTLDPRSTALVLIDLQRGIVGRELAPRPGPEVLERSIGLANRFRAAGAPVILVNVAWSPDMKDALKQPVDQAFQAPPGGIPPEFWELAEGLKQTGDICITKHQWGAFYGTEMDLQLRRRGVETIVLGGIATNMGVESTARDAWERGYAVVLGEDICSSQSAEMHQFAIEKILPRLSRVVSVADLAI